MDFVALAGLVLGPLLLARVPQLKPAPGGVVVSPTAPKLDMLVVGPAGEVTGQRPQPTMADDANMRVTMEPTVTFASPEALDRIAAALDDAPDQPLAIYAWQKTAKRYEALSTFFLLASAMTNGAFTVLGRALKPARLPTALTATKAGATGPTRVFGGGHIVAERRFPNGVADLTQGWTDRLQNARAAHPLGLLFTILFFYGATATAVRFIAGPSWNTFGWYAAYVFSISLCLRQVGKFARLATAIYPVTLLFFLVIAFRASFGLRAQRVRGARSAKT